MKRIVNLKKFYKYTLSFFGYFTLSVLDGKYSPFPLALLVANLYVGLKPFPSFILYAITFIPSMQIIPIFTGVIAGLIISVTFAFYNKFRKKPNLEIALICAISLVPYCSFAPLSLLPLKLIVSASIILSSFIMTWGAKIWLIKGLKYKFDLNDFCSAVFLYLCSAYGAIIAFGEGLYLAFSLFSMLICSLFIKGYSPLLIGAITSLPLALFRLSFYPISTFTILSLVICLASAYSKLFTTVLCAITLSCFYFFTDFFSNLSIYAPFYSFASLTLYLFFPVSLSEKYRKTLAIHKTDNLNKYSINMHRNIISSRLFEFASVFDEMKNSIEKLNQLSCEKQDLTSVIANDFLTSVCARCPSYPNCKSLDCPSYEDLQKIIGLARAKGSLNLVDLPKSVCEICDFQEDVVSFINKLVLTYSLPIEEREFLKQSRELIIKQTEGLSVSLKRLGADLSKQLQHDPDLENKIKDNLLRCGLPVKEIAFFKGGEEDELVIVTYSDFISHPLLLPAISETTGYKSVITTNNRISQDLSAITIKKAPSYDAMFGLANKVKFDKQKSGDTHSIIKISEGKFLMALNDGMGSGAKAEETSATAISLIETFYKAGLKSEIVLPLVNKLLSLGEEDTFTALDVGIIDLFNCKADFVKVGSPYSFIITKDTVKIIEGNSLPLGILEEMKPTVCRTDLSTGDVILFVSDGITDAFETSADLIDFLATQKALNPKTLADNILERALYLNKGIAKDDMTAFCVRIFKKAT